MTYVTPNSEAALLDLLQLGRAAEHRWPNLELKRNWDSKYGHDISALGNRLAANEAWMVIGVEDSGTLSGHNEEWARRTEQTISQQLNERLTPIQVCKSIRPLELSGCWIILISLNHPGDVVYWGSHAYIASGTTSRVLEPAEVLELRLRLPGLTDVTRQNAIADYDPALVSHFAEDVRRRSEEALPGDPLQIMRHLGLEGRQAARILFGNVEYRTVVYGRDGSVTRNDKHRGLYTLLRTTFLERLQDRSMPSIAQLYPTRGVHEAIANAVAHAAYFQSDGDIIIELFPDRLVIGNLCTQESTYFANRWFSRSHLTLNGLLMESLRIAGHVDELGRGKGLIFSEAIKAGRRPPEVAIEGAGRLSRWKLTLYATSSTVHYPRLLERCRSVYQDEMKSLIAIALVLWERKSVSEIRRYVDGDFAAQFAEVLSSLDGPIFYSDEADRIYLTRWARVLLEEGKDSKELSKPEEARLRAHAHQYAWRFEGGEITPAKLRSLAQMGDTPSERTMSTRILKSWLDEGFIENYAHGKYRFTRPPPDQKELRKTLEDLLARLTQD